MNFYANTYPNDRDIVIGIADKFDEKIGLYITLPEYNMEGLVSITELTKQQNKNKKLISPNTVLPLVVIHIDKKKKYVDLSCKRVPSSEVESLITNFNFTKRIYTIGNELSSLLAIYKKENTEGSEMRLLQPGDKEKTELNNDTNNDSMVEFKDSVTNTMMIDSINEMALTNDANSVDILIPITDSQNAIFQNIIWKLFDESEDRTKLYYNILNDPSLLFKYNSEPETKDEQKFSEKFIDMVNTNIKSRIVSTPYQISTKFSLFANDGNLDIINEILAQKLNLLDNEHIELMSPPTYCLVVEYGNKEIATTRLFEIMDNIKSLIVGNYSSKVTYKYASNIQIMREGYLTMQQLNLFTKKE
jgi:translation initiation factor 2 alpha subunit (eIF-2alpha)